MSQTRNILPLMTLADTKAPTVVVFSPSDGAKGVAAGSNIVLTFSEPVQRGIGRIELHSGSATGALVESFDASGSSRLTFSGNMLTIDPTGELTGNTRYYVTFAKGTVRDLAGNSYSGTSTYDFTTAPVTTAKWDSWSGYGLLNIDSMIEKATGRAIADAALYGDGYGTKDWHLNWIQAQDAWQAGYAGSGVIVAVVDTGVDSSHIDLGQNLWRNIDEIPGNHKDDDGNGYIDDIYGYDFVNGDAYALDDNGHGTHVAGLIAGLRNATGVTGVAYQAQIMSVKVMDTEGAGYAHDIAAGIYYAVNNGAGVINLSLGGGYSADIASALSYAVSRQVIVCMASGNSHQQNPIYPAALAQTLGGIAVGAVDKSGALASFSNGAGSGTPYDFVVAPGVNVYSTYPGNMYALMSGTSMATPIVSGAAALLLSASRDYSSNWTVQQLESMIATTAGPFSTSGSSAVSGQSSAYYQQNMLIDMDASVMDDVRLAERMPIALTGVIPEGELWHIC